jgi:L-alanine-DL-glutamate epimerase-like enolase superfamily enzyme
MDPHDNEAIWKNSTSNASGRKRGPVLFGGISAIDTALWDIRVSF